VYSPVLGLERTAGGSVEMGSKTVYLKSFGLLHSYLKIWAETPPEDYRFVYKDYLAD